ncbi:MAG: SDR family NAD(P)-dependent oxidoreductase, partial [Rhodospirillales bacterium]
MYRIDFSGKTVLVTGGSSGIGNGIARVFRDAGATVHVTGTKGRVAEYDSDLKGMHYYPLDVADDKAVDTFKPEFSRLDVLVNSVGTVAYKKAEFDMPGWRRVMDVNITGVMHCCTKFRPLLAASKGSIVIVSSMASFHAT